MNIQSVIPAVAEAPAKPDGKKSADAGAFEGTIRRVADHADAQKARNAAARRDDTAPTEDDNNVDDAKGATSSAKDDRAAASDDGDATAAKTTTSDLRALLNVIGSSGLTPAHLMEEAAHQAEGAEGSTKQGTGVVLPAGEDAEDMPAARATQLSVLRMETHFEPTMDGLAAEDGRAKAGEKADADVQADQAAKAIRLAAALDPRGGGASSDPAGKLAGAISLGAAADAVAGLKTGAKSDGKNAKSAETLSTETTEGKELSRENVRTTNRMVLPSDRAVEGREKKDTRSGLFGLSSDVETASAARSGTGAGSASSPLAGIGVQIGTKIVDVLGQGGSSSSASSHTAPGAAADALVRMRAGGAALKTMTIQLQPVSLGVVEVSMRIVDDKLTIQLAASREDTAIALRDDHEGLRKLLKHAGFSMDDGSITVVVKNDGSNMVSKSTSGEPTSSTGQNHGGAASSGSGLGEREAGSSPRRDGQRQGSGARPVLSETPSSSGHRGGSTYL